MDSKELLSSITQSFYADKKEHITFLSISDGLMELYHQMLDTDVITVDLRDNDTPLAPFLNILNNVKPTKKELEKNCYALQYDTFVSFLKNGVPNERKDPFIIEEIDYEKQRIRRTIVDLLKKLFNEKVVIFNAQLMGDDSLYILKELENNVCNGKFIFCFNNTELEKLTPVMKDYIHSISTARNYYAINSIDDMVSSYHYIKGLSYTYEQLKRMLKSYRMFLDLSKGCQLVREIDASNILLDFETLEAREIYWEMGLLSFYNGDTDMASFYLTSVTENQVDDELDCYSMYMMAGVACKKNMNSVALRYINKALSKAKYYENSPVYALATMMEYVITERTDSQYSTTKYFNALNVLDKFGFTNNRIYISLVIPYGIIYEKELRQQMLVQVKKGLEDAEKLGNEFGLSTACHWMGIIMTHEGKKEESLLWYKKCFALREAIGDISSITKVTNGLSYEYLIDTKYKLSYELINNCISNLLNTKDYPEVVITLYNIARTCFYSRNWELAYSLFQCIMDLMSIFELSDLSVNSFLPEYNDVVAYKAVIDFYKGEYTRAKMNLHNMMNNGRKFTPIEEFVKFYLNASVELEEGNKGYALELFNKFVEDFFAVGLSQEHRIVYMFYEFAICLDRKGYPVDAKEILKRGFEIAKEKKLYYFTKGKDSITIEDYINGVEKFPELKINLEELEEKAEKERLVNQLHKRLRDSQFLNKLVTTHVNNLNDMRFANNTVQSVFDYTMADAVFLAEKSDNSWNVLSSSMRDPVEVPDTDVWNTLITDSKIVDIIESKNSEERQIVYINLSKFEFVGGIICYLQKNIKLSVEEINILNIAALSIQAQLVMLKQNEHLTVISSTDQLSMLNNRRALQEHLSIESEMIRRYEAKKHLHMHESIAFMDLDNFKYYNDTFGHEAGDLLIACFAKLLKRIYRKVDFVSRFGGDEFVVLLPNTSTQEAKRAAERLKEGLENASHFIPDLEAMLNKKIYIPEEKYLGFSMGICSNVDGEDKSDLERAMTNADKALYYSKHHKKGSVTIWSDIKDQIDYKELESKLE